MERGASLASSLLLAAVAAVAGCGTARVVEPGLANAPAVPLNVTLDVHDVIANGHDSCPRARVAAGDPLRYRYPACPGGETAPQNVAPLAAPVVTQEPEDDLWNLHLRGLPPCEGSRAERARELALAVCRGE
jgi:hypothetical protein